MKRFVFLTLFFFLCSLAQPPQARAAIPLAVIGVAAIGAALSSVAVSNYQQTKVAINNNDDYKFDGSALTVPIVAYNTYVQASAQILLGYTADLVVDLETAYNQGLLSANSALLSVIESIWPPDDNNYAVGDKFTCPSTTGWSSTCYAYSTLYDDSWLGNFSNSAAAYVYYVSENNRVLGNCASGAGKQVEFTHGGVVYREGYKYGFYYDVLCLIQTSDEADQYGPPPILGPADVPKLAQGLSGAAAADPNVRKELDKVIADNPSLVQSPPGITSQDVQRYAQEAAKKALEEYAATTAANAAANPNDVAAQNAAAEAAAELAKAEAEDLADQADETFSAISDSPFGNAYNPGEFDIPGRFTTFLTNVKSSGLFSFSSDFFNSLPGGGSSVYEIDGGETFGHHSIDLSEILSGGLAVLKTILLAIFGFLSIRAVIMKR